MRRGQPVYILGGAIIALGIKKILGMHLCLKPFYLLYFIAHPIPQK
jgi:hypothetical protein